MEKFIAGMKYAVDVMLDPNLSLHASGTVFVFILVGLVLGVLLSFTLLRLK